MPKAQTELSGICVDGNVKFENAEGFTEGVPASKEIVPKLLGVYFETDAPLNLKAKGIDCSAQ